MIQFSSGVGNQIGSSSYYIQSLFIFSNYNIFVVFYEGLNQLLII